MNMSLTCFIKWIWLAEPHQQWILSCKSPLSGVRLQTWILIPCKSAMTSAPALHLFEAVTRSAAAHLRTLEPQQQLLSCCPPHSLPFLK